MAVKLGVKALDMMLADLSHRWRKATDAKLRDDLYHRMDHVLERRYQVTQSEMFEAIKKGLGE